MLANSRRHSPNLLGDLTTDTGVDFVEDRDDVLVRGFE